MATDKQVIDSPIYIHTSDTGTFKRCRRRWYWTSPMHENLRPKVTHGGLNFNLAFGTVIHRALEFYYKGLQTIPSHTVADAIVDGTEREPEQFDPVVVFEHEWLDLAERVKDLNEGWYLENEEEFNYHMELGKGMMDFYTTCPTAGASQDQFKVISTEHLFEVDTGLVARDRESGHTRPVFYRGRMDMVIQDLETERYGIMDHKTSSSHDDEDYFTKLDMDEQVTRYMWAAQLEALQNDLPYKKIDFVLYNVLFKAFPKPPTILDRGVPSLNRQTESTTAELFAELVVSNEFFKDWFTNSTKAHAYYEYLKEEGTRRFTIREMVKRNDYELEACGERVLMEIQDMLSHDLRIYPNATGEWYCIKCPFRAPCLAANDGSDVSYLLDNNYESNMTPEGEYTLI